MTRAASVLCGAVLLVWPALVNGYPLLFIDAAAYLGHTQTWQHPWDKTAAYGPLMLALHWRVSLWLVVAGQGLLLSGLLWLVQRVATGTVTPMRHGVLCLLLATLTTAPWFASLIMPDVMAGVVLLCLYLLGFGDDRLTRTEATLAGLLGAAAIATHLSYLPVAGSLVVAVLLLRRRIRPVLRTAAPVAAAVCFLLGANLIAFHRPVLSAHGAFFLLARLQADGPVVDTLRAHCPDRGWFLCEALPRLPMDADSFLWRPDNPIVMDASGHRRDGNGLPLVGQAQEILAVTIRDRPLAVARAMAANTLRQAVAIGLGDTLDPSDLVNGVQNAIAAQFGPAERAQFDAGLQMQRRMEAVAAAFAITHQAVAALSLLALLGWLVTPRVRQDPRRTGFALIVLVGLAANAFATGALSGPHDRYGARIIWVLPLAALIAYAPRPAARP